MLPLHLLQKTPLDLPTFHLNDPNHLHLLRKTQLSPSNYLQKPLSPSSTPREMGNHFPLQNGLLSLAAGRQDPSLWVALDEVSGMHKIRPRLFLPLQRLQTPSRPMPRTQKISHPLNQHRPRHLHKTSGRPPIKLHPLQSRSSARGTSALCLPTHLFPLCHFRQITRSRFMFQPSSNPSVVLT
jgi:hypothetical protein